jgi:hypothetical protein
MAQGLLMVRLRLGSIGMSAHWGEPAANVALR